MREALDEVEATVVSHVDRPAYGLTDGELIDALARQANEEQPQASEPLDPGLLKRAISAPA
jgi:hypothetical protein